VGNHGWDIEASGVRSVVGRTQAKAHEFEGQMKRLQSAMKAAAAASHSPIVSAALEGFVNAELKQIRFVFTRTGACMNAAARATNHYLEGDREMAAHAQAAATKAPQPAPILPGSRSKTAPGATAATSPGGRRP
jgi:hypothetical protein